MSALSAGFTPSRARLSQQLNARRSSDMFRSPVSRSRPRTLAAGVALALVPIGGMFATTAAQAAPAPPPRPQGPCDIYAFAGTPCVAAHSTTRALYAAYDGPLYQVRRLSDGRVK